MSFKQTIGRRIKRLERAAILRSELGAHDPRDWKLIRQEYKDAKAALWDAILHTPEDQRK